MKVTKEQIRKLLPGQVLTIPCDNTAELDSTYQTAMQVKREEGMFPIAITRSGKTNTIIIRRETEND